MLAPCSLSTSGNLSPTAHGQTAPGQRPNCSPASRTTPAPAPSPPRCSPTAAGCSATHRRCQPKSCSSGCATTRKRPGGDGAERHHSPPARCTAGRLRHPIGQRSVPGRQPVQGLLTSRLRRRPGQVLPARAGPVPTVPSGFSQLRAGRTESWDGSTRPTDTSRPGPTSTDDGGTDGTAPPRGCEHDARATCLECWTRRRNTA